MIYSNDYQEVQKKFDELSVYDKELFIKKNINFLSDKGEELDDLDIENLAEEMGMINPDYMSGYEFVELVEDNILRLTESDIKELKKIIEENS